MEDGEGMRRQREKDRGKEYYLLEQGHGEHHLLAGESRV